MPFTNAPSNDTYSSHRVSLIHDLDLAPIATLAGRTAGLVNVLTFKNTGPDADKVPVYGETRDVLTCNTVVTPANITSVCRGFYVWEKTAGTIYYFVAMSDGTTSKVYTSTNNSTWSVVNTLTTDGTTPIRFAEFISSTNTKSLVMVDGLEGYVFTSNAAGTKITDVDFPTPHVPFPVFLDGYLFLAKSNTGDIYNSDLDNPSSWTAGSFISSELYPDDVQALVKVNNYLLAIGASGSEYFYDAAIATASPLARMEGQSLPFGTMFPNSIASNRDTVVMLANSNDGDSCFKVIDGFKFKDLPAEAVLRALTTVIGTNTSAACVRGNFFRKKGSLFYLFTLNGTAAFSGNYYSLACSLQTGYWSGMQFSNLSSFPVCWTAPSTSSNLKTYVAGCYYSASTSTIFSGIFDESTSTAIDTLGGSAPFIQELIVPAQTFGTLNRKQMSRIGLYYWGLDNNFPAVPITLSYSDNNTFTWSTARSFSTGQNTSTNANTAETFPFITQLGEFRKRAFKITMPLSGVKIRWYYLECDINKGQQ